MNQNVLMCDIAIVGAGAGGLSVAAVAAQLGLKVILIEANKMGGDCLNFGCVPSKSLLSAAKTFYHAKTASHFGVQAENFQVNFSAVMKHVHDVIKTIEKNDSVERFESLGAKVILGKATFVDEEHIQVNDKRIKAKRFVIATGSSPFIPPIPGLETTPHLTNETIFDLKEQPKHLIVIGGGPIGCELAQAFGMLGSQVTVLEGMTILPKDESDCVAVVRDQLKKMNICLEEKAEVKNVASENDNIKVVFEKDGQTRSIDGSHLLVATGRRANVSQLQLEKANVEYSPKGIMVDQRLRTNNKRIYAIGDVIGGFQFTHMANYHAGIVIRNLLFRWPAKVDYRAVPWVTYTYPELAHVGLSALEAKAQSGFHISEWPFEDNDRAQTAHEIQGKIKIITGNKGRILGVTIVGDNAGELIIPWVMAIRENKTLRAFTDMIFPYPTLSEISKRVAGEFYTPTLFSKKTRWLVRLLFSLG